MIIVILLFASLAVNFLQGFINIKALKRLLQFDSIFESIIKILSDYGIDLNKTLSSGLLQDNPEIISFHKRNSQALAEIEAAVKNLEQIRPSVKVEIPKGNPPIWE